MQNVLDFGAKGDGSTLDTAAIQNAINAGGMVYIPKGTYLTGTLYLKSNGGLYLEAGATLRASHNREDYNADDFCEQNEVFSAELVTGAHLIVAVEQENIFIKGEGTIDGEGRFWMNENNRIKYQLNENSWIESPEYAANPERPGQMIFLCECKNVMVSGVHIVNGPYWHLFLHGCEDVIVKGVTIRGDKTRWTNDGIDIDCCSRVTVSDCLIEVGDDAITLRANGKALKKKEAVCEHVTITNCVLTAYMDYGVRIGVGYGAIRNCTLSNLIIHNSHAGIGMTARFISGGTNIENIILNSLQIFAHRPLELRLSAADGMPPVPASTHIRGVHFSNSLMKGDLSSCILGYENGDLSDIVFSNMDIIYSGCGARPCAIDERGFYGYDSKDMAFEIRKAKEITFKDVRISWEGDAAGWHYDMTLEQTEKVTFDRCTFLKGIKEME